MASRVTEVHFVRVCFFIDIVLGLTFLSPAHLEIKSCQYLLCPEAVAEQVDLAALHLLLAAAVAVQTVHEAGPPAAAQTPCVHRQ